VKVAIDTVRGVTLSVLIKHDSEHKSIPPQ
jgi:hypothetical protein